MRRKRLLWQIFAAYFWISVIAMLLVGLDAARTTRGVYLDEIAAQLERNARLTGQRIVAHEAIKPSADVQAACADLGGLLGIRITAIAHDGRVLADTPRTRPAWKTMPIVRRSRQHWTAAWDGKRTTAIRWERR